MKIKRNLEITYKSPKETHPVGPVLFFLTLRLLFLFLFRHSLCVKCQRYNFSFFSSLIIIIIIIFLNNTIFFLFVRSENH